MTPAREENDPRWLLDLVVVGVLTVATAAVLLVPDVPRPTVWVFGVPFLLLYPGYAVVAALFPEAGATPAAGTIRPEESPGTTARLGLAMVLSPIVVGAVALGANVVVEIRLAPVVVGLTAITLGCLSLAAIRRKRLPPGLRASMPGTGSPVGSFPGSTVQTAVFALSIIALVGIGLAVVANPPAGDAYTEAYLLQEDATGDLVANGLPSNLTAEESTTLTIGIENHENDPTTYEVYTVSQGVGSGGEVRDQERLDGFRLELGDDRERVVDREITPTRSGERRIQVLIYEDEGPSEDPSGATADHVLQFWVSVDRA